MSKHDADSAEAYYREAASWSADRQRSDALSRKIAWSVAGGAVFIALAEAIALMALAPLKQVVPYTILVDRQTGNVQALKPLDRQDITPDDALVRSFLAQYVVSREQFEINTLRADYRKVALWSAGDARQRYLASMQASNPLSPLSSLPRQAVVDVEVLSISALNAETALVRFTTSRTDPGARAGPRQHWIATINYRFSGARMSDADRLFNPLGFQVLRYRRNAETVPLDQGAEARGSAASAAAQAQ